MHKNMQLMLLRSLRKDQHAVGTNGKRGVEGEAVRCCAKPALRKSFSTMGRFYSGEEASNVRTE